MTTLGTANIAHHPGDDPGRGDSLKARGIAKPRCGICQFRLSTGKQPSSVDAEGHTALLCEAEAPGLLPEFGISARRGCTSCTNIFNFLLRHGAVQADLQQRGARWLEIRIVRSDKTAQNFVFVTDPTFSPEELSRIYPPLGRGLAAAAIKGTAEDQTLGLAKHWWEMCTREHHCRVGPCSYIPHRLLRLEHNDDDEAATHVSLVENLAGPVEYVALSHRWSEETKAVSLLTSNRHQMSQRGLVSSQLPRLSAYISASAEKIRAACC